MLIKIIGIFIDLLKKYKSVILYIIFGVLTTLVNIATYYIFYNLLCVANVISTIVAWILAVVFAFVVNKLFVFESVSWRKDIVFKEIRDFFTCRILTGLLDVGIMYVAVDLLSWNSMIWKLISNILVTMLNYIASKFIIFKRT